MSKSVPAIVEARDLASHWRSGTLERNQLRSFIDLFPVGVVVVEGTTRTVNTKVQQILGVTNDGDRPKSAAFAAHEFRTLDGRKITPEEAPTCRALGGAIVDADRYRLRRGDGEERIVAMSAAPIRGESGEVVGAVSVWQDVTEETLAEERRAVVAKAHARLTSSFDFAANLSEVATLLAPSLADWCVVDLFESDSARRIEVEGSDPTRASLAERARRALASGRRPAGSPAVVAFEERRTVLIPSLPSDFADSVAINDAHREVLLEARLRSALVVPLIAHGAVLGTLGLYFADSGRRYSEHDVPLAEELARHVSDALEASLLYREAQCARAAAETASRAKDEFLAMLGHELRNPLAPIETALFLMSLRADAAFVDEREVIGRQVQHLTRLVDDLLDVSRITGGKLELHKQPTEIARVVAKAVELASPLFEQKRHRLSVDVSHRGLVVEADELRLAQVFANLLTNAAKYTDPEGDIQLSARREQGTIVVEVVDDGIGISPELLPHVFELFVQGSRSLDRSQGGLGLGLAIVRTLVTMHDGEVRAESVAPGRGSRFVVRLPALVEEVRAEPVPAIAPSAPPAAAPRLVLIVDDNADAANMLEKAVRAAGHRVVVAHDGPGALSWLDGGESAALSAAILDIGLPVMDGYELAARVRERRPGVRLIAVTGYGQEHDRRRSVAAGFDEHLVKPVDLARLMRIVDAG